MPQLRSALLALLAAATTPAQCQVQGLFASPYGSSCGTSGSPFLSASFWTPGCAVQITAIAPLLTNMNSTQAWLIFALSAQQAVVPVLSPCLLPQNPIVVLPVAPVSITTLPIPPGLGPFTFWIHSVSAYDHMILHQTSLAPAQQGLQITVL